MRYVQQVVDEVRAGPENGQSDWSTRIPSSFNVCAHVISREIASAIRGSRRHCTANPKVYSHPEQNRRRRKLVASTITNPRSDKTHLPQHETGQTSAHANAAVVSKSFLLLFLEKEGLASYAQAASAARNSPKGQARRSVIKPIAAAI